MTHIKWPNELGLPVPHEPKWPNELGPPVPYEPNWQGEAMRLSALLHNALTRAATAEAKLARAVETLRVIAEKPIWGRGMVQWVGGVTILAVDTLAELETKQRQNPAG